MVNRKGSGARPCPPFVCDFIFPWRAVTCAATLIFLMHEFLNVGAQLDAPVGRFTLEIGGRVKSRPYTL